MGNLNVYYNDKVEFVWILNAFRRVGPVPISTAFVARAAARAGRARAPARGRAFRGRPTISRENSA